ncbi:MAG: hypothetical protein COB04_14900 [Gammaproteobacteria bacterium]|nr:MAG: hypothetical protein COB04_14900 [Gammaproteobacteria bacterium]
MVALLGVGLMVWLDTIIYPAKLSDFSPTVFEDRELNPFFHSSEGELYFSRSIEDRASPIYEGAFNDVIVSPDNTMCIVVTDWNIILVDTSGARDRTIVNVRPVGQNPKPIGEAFYRNQGLQWSSDSKRIYLIKDEYYETNGSQLFSDKAKLYYFDLTRNELVMAVPKFKAYKYFLGVDDNIYFWKAEESGGMNLVGYSKKAGTNLMGRDRVDQLEESGEVFFSFSRSMIQEEVLNQLKVRVAHDPENVKQQLLYIEDDLLLMTEEGMGIKGQDFGLSVESYRANFTPGGKYLLLDLYTKEYEGQILVDLELHRYKIILTKSIIYHQLNTFNFPGWRIYEWGVGMEVLNKEFQAGSLGRH